MSLPAPDRERLLTLLDAVCDQRASVTDMAEIERLVLASAEARWLYLAYVDLHGTLVWDAAGGLGVATPAETFLAAPQVPAARARLSRWIAAVAVVCVAVLAGVGVGRYGIPEGSTVQIAAPSPAMTNPVKPAETPDPAQPKTRRPVELATVNTPVKPATADGSTGDPAHVADVVAPVVAMNPPIEPEPLEFARLDDVEKVSRRVDWEFSKIWHEAQVTPSPRAEETEWLRRVMLDLSGRIPTVVEVEQYLADDRTDKRRLLVDRLLDDGDYVRNFSTVWLNLLIGRSPPAQVDRDSFQKFLRMSLAANKPWNTMVAELLSAEGRTDENGAANYLVAHLNNQAVPATAITSRLFLGQQLHCAQCHNHPFNEVQQAAFWELNSLFQQTAVVTRGLGERAMNGGARKGPPIAALVTQPEGGPIYYETTNGLMKVAFPRFNGQDVDPAPEVNRRRELARLLTTTAQPQLAAAFVNRMWAHFFGAGFTTPVDDMGPHNPPCHPEVLNRLRDEFVQSGYDIKQLTRWITATDAYQRGSRATTGNQNDDPTTGDIPWFSRVYPQPMSAEQLYDSVVTATQAHQASATDWTVAEGQRRAWLEEFVVSLQNDENDEAETLSGTYSQALTLMNGDLMTKALDPGPGTFLGDLVRSKLSETEKIRRLYLAALSRPPTAKELASLQHVVRKAGPRPAAGVYQDIFWAVLNSNEFAIVH